MTVAPTHPPPPPPPDPPEASDRAKRIARRISELDYGTLPYPATRAIAIAIDEELARLYAEIRCQTCGGSGTITDRNGDLDECPECRGEGARR